MPDKVLKTIKPRKYQQEIYESCKEKNCLVVLPTGIGKTLVALMLSVYTQKKFPGSKSLFLAPTRPLAEQHLAYFKKHLPELFAELTLFTGKTFPEKRQELWETADIIFSTPQCVEENTLIFTKEGPIKISEFFKKFEFKEENYGDKKGKIANIQEKVLGYDGKTIRFLEASKAWKQPGDGLIKIKTDIGNNLVCTKEHPILTINQEGEIFFKEASLLKKGDYIASAKEINVEEESINILKFLSNNSSLKIAEKQLTKNLIQRLKEQKIKCTPYSRYFYNFMPLKLFLELAEKTNFNYNSLKITDECGRSNPVSIPQQIDSKLTYIIGAMLGDGHIGNRKGHGAEVVFSDLDRESVSNEFQESVLKVFGVKMKKDPIKGLVTYNSAFASMLTSFGVTSGNKAKHIRVPRFLFFSNKELVNGFIKGIFDTDGNASKYGVSISSASEKFIQDLKWLFLKIGILGNIEKRINKGIINGRKIKESELFTFCFSGRKNLQKFLKVYPNQEKCRKLIETLNNTKKPETRSKEILPVPILMKKIHKVNMKKAEYYKFSCLSLDNLRNLSKNLEGKDASKLKSLLNLPLRWVKIKEKEKINEKKEVYDLTIEKDHNFITNCLVSHNCIGNDIRNNLYDLREVSLLIEDECHRCFQNYAYTYVAEKYKEQAKNQRILGLTASPGVDKKKIEQIAKNLGIESIELRTRESEDVKEYLQELEFEIIPLDFPEEIRKITEIIRGLYSRKIQELKNRKLLFEHPTKISILKLQSKIMGSLSAGRRDFNMMAGASACAQAIKLSHLIELLETQTLQSASVYIKSMFQQASENKSKAVKQIVKNKEFNQAYIMLNELISRNIEHPKLAKLKEIIQGSIKENPKNKTIIFSQYRDTIVKIHDTLKEIQGINAKIFVGQAKKGKLESSTGLSQKEQQEIMEDFRVGKTNLIIASSIGEEGLDIPEVNSVIFYEPIPSAIRKIQRAGRTARLMKGKLIILLTKGTLDEIFHYASKAKEKRMYHSIESIKKDMDDGTFKTNNEKQEQLNIEKEANVESSGSKNPETHVQKKLFPI